MSSHPGSHPVTAHPSEGLSGTMRVPGDKSISHRSVMLGGLAIGETRVTGMLEGEDVMATAAAMRAMGASVERLVGSDGAVEWVIRGVGNGGLAEPAEVLDMGNAGTGARLLMGILATHDMTAVMTGDGSLCSRPMKRVMDPLSQFGATFMARSGGRLPLAIRGKANSVPVTYRVPMPSAQVKSAVLLAGLNAMGDSTAIEAVPTRDHTELMFAHFGIPIRTAETDDGAKAITVTGGAEIIGRPVLVPADPSSAAFPTVAALIVPDSEVTLPNVGLNPHRDGLFRTLREMGADIAYTNERREAGEPVADLVIKTSALTGIEVPSERAPSMIDEYPVLAVAAACAKGTTR
ncbi:MAG: 3-phosphoshikimate 1-carboxyvinyltransferase, partial [Rhodospirillaceae bacterium]